MKNRSFISILVILFAVTSMTTSCDDMLTPDLTRYSENFAQDSVYSAFGILKSIQKIGTRTVVLDAARSDLATVGTYTTDSIKVIANFENSEDASSALFNAADYYHIINSCNFYLSRVDTISSKNGVNEMIREATQIEVIRAWTYLQLVRYYGSVPYITKPIADAEQAKALEKSAPRATKDNLIDYLVKDRILNVLANQKRYGMPNYGDVNNGARIFSSRNMFFPAQLIIADAYLMKNDYAKAAQYYYDYFYYAKAKNNNSFYMARAHPIYQNNFISGYILSAGNWSNVVRSTDEVIAYTAGAANTTMGTMMTDLQNIFGFKTSSTQSDNASAIVFTSPNESYQQILPSKSYISLNEKQKFCMWESDNGVSTITYVDGYGDGRLYGTAPYYEFIRGNKTQIIDKYCIADAPNSFESVRFFYINYMVPIYRVAQIWLRYAEAINRMGFPQLAFGILKDGLIRENIPNKVDRKSDMNMYVLNPTDRTDTIGIRKLKVDSVGNFAIVKNKWGVVTSATFAADTLLFADGHKPYSELISNGFYTDPTAYNGGMYYMTIDELDEAAKYPYLDFVSNDRFSEPNAVKDSYSGIHSRGCGDTGGIHDTIYTYARMVAKKIAENYARENKLTYDEQLAYEKTLHHGDTLLVTDKSLIINAVEDLIIDESALETAFEGHRFTDLLRFADHKSAAGLDGVNWLAWKIARRDLPVTANASEVDASLYSKIQNQKNWYFSLPKK